MSTDFPQVRIFAWDVGEIASPVGNRTLAGGSFAFKHIVSSGCSTADPNNPSTTSGILVFGGTKFDFTGDDPASELASSVAAITINVANSGVGVSDIKLYLVQDTVFQASKDEGLDPGFLQFATSGSFWAHKGLLPSGAGTQMTTAIPALQNVFRQDGGNALVGQDDSNSSEFIYMNVVLPLGTPLGSYGVCGSGLLRLGLIFNYWCNDFILSFGDPGQG